MSTTAVDVDESTPICVDVAFAEEKGVPTTCGVRSIATVDVGGSTSSCVEVAAAEE